MLPAAIETMEDLLLYSASMELQLAVHVDCVR